MRTYNVPALEKAVRILDLVAQSSHELSASEICSALAIPKATAFLLLTVLERYELLKKNANGRYAIGIKLYKLGLSYIPELDIVKVAHPHLEALMHTTSFTAHAGILDDGRILFVDKVEPNAFVRFSTFPGMRSDIHMSSLGKAIAAYLPQEQVQHIISTVGLGAYTPKTITDPARFATELAHIRATGYAVEDEEGELNVRCIGAPIFDVSNKIVAALSITALLSQLPDAAIATTGQHVCQAAQRVSAELGYTGNAFAALTADGTALHAASITTSR